MDLVKATTTTTRTTTTTTFVDEQQQPPVVDDDHDDDDFELKKRRMFDPTITSSTDFVSFLCDYALQHNAVNHVYLQRLSKGNLPDMKLALCQWVDEYHVYGNRFTEFMSTILNDANEKHCQIIRDDLKSEEGLLDDDDKMALQQLNIDPKLVDGIPHRELFQQMRLHIHQQCGNTNNNNGNSKGSELSFSDLEDDVVVVVDDGDKNNKSSSSSPGIVFTNEISTILQNTSLQGRAAVMGIATEMIVPTIYQYLLQAMERLSSTTTTNSNLLQPQHYVFLLLHVHVDEKHGNAMTQIVQELVQESDNDNNTNDNNSILVRRQMFQAVQDALEARVRLWNNLLSNCCS